jgi:hypothetical protein
MNKTLFEHTKNYWKKKNYKKKMGKEKFFIMKNENISKIYSNLYNNEKYSDITIEFENSKEKIKSHKLILNTFSSYFEKITEKDNILLNEEPKEIQKMIKFFYELKINEKEEPSEIIKLIFNLKKVNKIY